MPVSKISAKVGLHLVKAVKHYFPDITSLISRHVKDPRDNRGKTYSIDDAILSVVIMFLLKEGSRNSYNQDRAELRFSRNVRRLLKIRLLHGDSFNDIMAAIDENDLQKLKSCLVKILIAHKICYPYRHDGKYIVAIDGTGTHAFDDDYSGSCLSKTSKNGVVSYSHAVLEAKLVTSNGFCISLASVWLENNEEGQHHKQDCELSAFKRLAVKLKELYPRLPMLIVADALYANQPVMEICKGYLWDYMLVIKDGVLKDLNEEISLRPDKKIQVTKRGKVSYLNELKVGQNRLYWLKWEELGNNFSWVTNLQIKDETMATKLQEVGRLRWKIENEGFNAQKNLGYGLEHKYSRISFNATKNYYQCMQIAHLIEQLTLLAKSIKILIDCSKASILKISERLRNLLVYKNMDGNALQSLLERKIQIRYE